MMTPHLEPLRRRVVAYVEDVGIAVHDAISLGVWHNRAGRVPAGPRA